MFGLKFNRFNTLYCYFIRRLIFVQSIFRKWNNFSFLLFYLIFFFVSLSYRYFNRSATGNNKLMFRINSSSLSLSLCKLFKKIHKINLPSRSQSQSKRRCEERIIENFSAGALNRRIHDAIRVLYRREKEKKRGYRHGKAIYRQLPAWE